MRKKGSKPFIVWISFPERTARASLCLSQGRSSTDCWEFPALLQEVMPGEVGAPGRGCFRLRGLEMGVRYRHGSCVELGGCSALHRHRPHRAFSHLWKPLWGECFMLQECTACGQHPRAL